MGEDEGGMIRENSIETCILSYVKQIASPGSMHETRCSGLVYPEGWDGEGRGRGVQDGEHKYTHGWFMSIYDKKHYNIVISLQLNKLKQTNKQTPHSMYNTKAELKCKLWILDDNDMSM